MQVTSYNPHLGLLRSEHCWGEHRTVYSGRSEADVVMTSIRHDFSFRGIASRLRDFEARISTMNPMLRRVPSGRQAPDHKGRRQSRLGLLAGDQSESKDTCLRAARRSPTDRPILVKIKSPLPHASFAWLLSSRASASNGRV